MTRQQGAFRIITVVGLFLTLTLAAFQAAAQTVVFHHSAETSPICCSDSSSYQFSLAQSRVTRSQDIAAKSGSWVLRHDVVLPGDIQTGKALKYFSPWTGLQGSGGAGITEAYFSAWYYIPSTSPYAKDPGNWERWTNFFEWKPDNHSGYQYTPVVGAPIGAKLIISLRWLAGAPRWLVEAFTLRNGTASFPAGKFGHNWNNNSAKWANQTFRVPFDEWVFLEARVKMSRTDGAVQIWSGKQSEGVLHLLHDWADPELNTLSMSGSSNKFLYWVTGNYLDASHSAGTWRFYTDDQRIAVGGRIGPTLAEFSGSAPAAPKAPINLRVTP